MITTAEAFADSGTEACRFSYLTAARVNVGVGRVAEDPGLFGNDEYVRFSGQVNPTGACPCGGTVTRRYSYFVRFTSPITGATNFITATNLTAQFRFQNLGTMTMTATTAPDLATC